MADKIKITSLEKTEEYLDREWAAINSQRYHMLASSDWTQMPDVKLTRKSRSEWIVWREKVRLVSRKVDSLAVADSKLKELESSKPVTEYGSDPIDDEIKKVKDSLSFTLAVEPQYQDKINADMSRLLQLLLMREDHSNGY